MRCVIDHLRERLSQATSEHDKRNTSVTLPASGSPSLSHNSMVLMYMRTRARN